MQEPYPSVRLYMNKLKRKDGAHNSRFGNIKNKVILIGVGFLVIAIGIIIILRFSNPEDVWICTRDGWVKHGNPADEMPKAGCEVPVNTPEL